MNLELDKYQDYKEKILFGRYITNESISKLKKRYNFSIIGESSNNLPIFSLKRGSGSVKILIWSQMHGNESTSTKALFDCLSFFDKYERDIFSKVTLFVVPILNPDGALNYTRENINNVDLNRDAQSLSQVESYSLRHEYNQFNPDFCFNLHDQRTIYSVKGTKPSVLSFLSPSADIEKSETNSRKDSMRVIASINKKLSLIIPGNISRYKDDFNINCVGDTFQSLNTPTILFESGHIGQDYEREKIREYMCYALIQSIKSIVFKEFVKVNFKDYYLIPENTQYLCDIFLKNVNVIIDNKRSKTCINIMFSEVLDIEKKEIKLEPYINKYGDYSNMSGHLTLDFNTVKKCFDLSSSLVINELMVYVNELRIIQ
ncbi:DUF2817 domain-containing protein [Flavobacteriaceae bacterium]|nr:DUF2817 domain-containing protein [Flavobacteriaceae bacterium]